MAHALTKSLNSSDIIIFIIVAAAAAAVARASIFDMNGLHLGYSYNLPLYPFSHKRMNTHISKKILCKIFTRFFYWSFVHSSAYCMWHNTCATSPQLFCRIQCIDLRRLDLSNNALLLIPSPYQYVAPNVPDMCDLYSVVLLEAYTKHVPKVSSVR